MTEAEITALAELCAAAEADYADDWNAAIEADERPDLWEPPVVEVQVRALRALLAERSAPTPLPVPAITREELVELINRELRSYELYGGNILDAIATYHNDETVKEALETVGDWSAWLADTILSRLNPTEPK